jgi:hypothetical protein
VRDVGDEQARGVCADVDDGYSHWRGRQQRRYGWTG